VLFINIYEVNSSSEADFVELAIVDAALNAVAALRDGSNGHWQHGKTSANSKYYHCRFIHQAINGQ
jgi:hypothetical protein